MRAAWHFWFTVSFCGESGLRKASLGGTHPLTRRYAPKIGFTSMLLWRIRIISIF
ncbi:TPA: DUF3265 domain-containing protein [Vibrio vulnificus]|nr:DUF3265 domain-containing protein [Vibrio vulnificus]HDY8057837.1 DUF3265 domain-containing protein [Vibrio vulnificus]